MKVIVPNTLSLLSCSISETDAVDGPIWKSGTTYSLGSKVRLNHVSYESLSDGNRNMNPEQFWNGPLAAWKKLGATMPYRMLDPYVETQTLSTTDLSFCVPYNRADAFSLLNVAGAVARIRIYDNDDTENPLAYDESIPLVEDIFHVSLWEYNYLPIQNIINFSQTELPQVVNGRMCIEITAADDKAAIGHVIVGREHQLGYTQYGAEIGLTDYSRKNVDEFGVATLVKRSYAYRASLPVYVHPDQQDYVVGVLSSVRGIPALWMGDNSPKGHSAFTVYGWLEDFRMTCEGPSENQLSLEIQGLI